MLMLPPKFQDRRESFVLMTTQSQRIVTLKQDTSPWLKPPGNEFVKQRLESHRRRCREALYDSWKVTMILSGQGGKKLIGFLLDGHVTDDSVAGDK